MSLAVLLLAAVAVGAVAAAWWQTRTVEGARLVIGALLLRLSPDGEELVTPEQANRVADIGLRVEIVTDPQTQGIIARLVPTKEVQP